MLDPVLLVALAAVTGATAAVAPLPAWLALVSSALMVWRRAGPTLVLTAVAVFAASHQRAAEAVQEWERSWQQAREDVGADARCSARARVSSSPTLMNGSVSFLAELEALECDGRTLSLRTTARLYGGLADVRRGDRLEIVAQIAPVQLFRNTGLADLFPSATRRRATLSGGVLAAAPVSRDGGLRAWSDALRNRARERVDATFAPAAAPLGRALVLGESDLSPEDDHAFKQSGLAHLLAVSGTHLVLAVLSVVGALRAILVRIEPLAARFDVGRLSSAIGIPLALAYADFAGGSGSAWRAAWMLAASFLARALGRHPSPLRSLALSFLVGAAWDPLVAFDVSFLLSAGATAGLVVLGPRLAGVCRKLPTRPLRWLAASLSTTLSAMLPCAPLLALISPELTLAGALSNVIAAPLGELLALPLCLVHPLTAWLPALEKGTALAASGALLGVKHVACFAASVRWLAIAVPPPTSWELAVLIVALVGMGTTRRRGLVAGSCALAFLLFELGAVRAGRPLGKLGVQVLDVGQGDSLLVDLPDGKLMLIDGGGFVGSPVDPGKRVIAPLLRARRRSRVDVVVLSHPHPDHFTGLSSALGAVEVGEIWDTGQGEAEGAGPVYSALLSELRARGVPVRRPPELCPKVHRYGDAVLRVLAPCPVFVPGRGANDNSFVLRLELGGRAALLMGDAEREEEREILERDGLSLGATFLKVGHHGSRTSTTAALLDAVRPMFAGVSCGVRNRFGHPHSVALQRLHEHGVHTLRTDQQGSIRFETDGRTASVELARP